MLWDGVHNPPDALFSEMFEHFECSMHLDPDLHENKHLCLPDFFQSVNSVSAKLRKIATKYLKKKILIL